MAGSGTAHLRPDADVVLSVEHLAVEFGLRRRGVVSAVADVSFDVARGETLGVVGESGCGKTTAVRAVMGLERRSRGRLVLRGDDLDQLDGERARLARRAMQMIFQDPVSSLNPRRRVRDLVREGVEIWRRPPATKGAGRADGSASGGDDPLPVDIDALMRSVGLEPDVVDQRRPHELSGGQCQRICIARALAVQPEVLLLDEPVSALDVSVQAQILNLLEQLKRDFDLTMVFISHDLSVVKNISDRILVMYLGKVCEVAGSDELFAEPVHPYTRVLLASIPGNDLGLPPASELITGEPPSPVNPPSGCRLRTRCPRATERCAVEEPELAPVRGSTVHFVACHHPEVDGADPGHNGSTPTSVVGQT